MDVVRRNHNSLATIHLNGELQEVPEGLTLAALLDRFQLAADRVAVECNLHIVPREEWSERLIHDGDKLEIVQFVGGG
jgi:thiamine biosynthesis protein ThiS